MLANGFLLYTHPFCYILIYPALGIVRPQRICKFVVMKRGIIINFLVALCLGLSFISCEKQYTCVCTKVSNNQEEPVETVKTTKLGRKGFQKSCEAKSSEGNGFKDCHIE